MLRVLLIGATIIFSQELAQQIMNELQKHPYAEVAPLIAKMQEEAMHQPQAPASAPAPPPETPK
jgi:hypothetical protein